MVCAATVALDAQVSVAPGVFIWNLAIAPLGAALSMLYATVGWWREYRVAASTVGAVAAPMPRRVSSRIGAAMQTRRKLRPARRPLVKRASSEFRLLGRGCSQRVRLFFWGRGSMGRGIRRVFGVRNQPPSLRSNRPLTEAHAWKGTSRNDSATAPRTPW